MNREERIGSLQELTLNKFSRGNLKYFCVYLLAKEESSSFSLFFHTLTALLSQACRTASLRQLLMQFSQLWIAQSQYCSTTLIHTHITLIQQQIGANSLFSNCLKSFNSRRNRTLCACGSLGQLQAIILVQVLIRCGLDLAAHMHPNNLPLQLTEEANLKSKSSIKIHASRASTQHKLLYHLYQK